MNSIYLIESDNYGLIDLEVKRIIKENDFSYDELIKYDLEETNIVNVINELDTYGFFQNRKIVFGSNATFLGTSKCEIDHNIESLTKYINNPKEGSILILSCAKMDGKKNICKLLKDKSQVISPILNRQDYIKNKLKSYKIKQSDISYLIDTVGDDFTRLDNELDKLMSLKLEEKEITSKDIDLIVIKKIDDNIFNLIDAIISKNKKKSLTIYNEIINYGEDISKIFIMLANQIRLIYQVKVLKNLPNDEIGDILYINNPKQIVALKYKIDKYKEKDLLDYLYKLSLMDEELKLGHAIDKIIFPIFIANL